MKYSTRLSDAVHVLIYIWQNQRETVTSSQIANSIHTNPSYVRQLMSQLKNAGILRSTQGCAKPTLERPAEDITLLAVYRAVEGEKLLLHQDQDINPGCRVGTNIQASLAGYYRRVQDAAEREMASISLKDIIDTYLKRMDRENEKTPPAAAESE